MGDLEEERGVARRNKEERHFMAAMNLLRGQMFEELDDAPGEVRACADAYYVGLYCGYYQRRMPGADASFFAAHFRTATGGSDRSAPISVAGDAALTLRCATCGAEYIAGTVLCAECMGTDLRPIAGA